jgi:hypothetical protein
MKWVRKSKVEVFAKDIRKYTVATYFKEVEGPPFFFGSSFYLTFLPLTHTKATYYTPTY